MLRAIILSSPVNQQERCYLALYGSYSCVKAPLHFADCLVYRLLVYVRPSFLLSAGPSSPSRRCLCSYLLLEHVSLLRALYC